MRRMTLTVVAILLAVPAAASAKVGVEFEQDPATVGPGEKMAMNIMILREPKDPLAGEMTPAVGAHPIVTFRSTSGRVVRVRGAASDEHGVSHASVRLPDHGPWTTTMHVPGVKLAEGGGPVGTIKLGAGQAPPGVVVTEVMRPPAQAPPAAQGGDSSSTWILLGGFAALAALAFAAVRTGVPGRLRTRFGGGGA